MNTIPEHLIDRHIERTAKFAADSDTGLKYACISASSVVGTYDGTTQEIARLTRRSVSSVENWAHAHWLYKDLRRTENIKRVRQLWRLLPASHWWKAYEIHANGYDALFYLDNAETHGWSGRGMMAEYVKERETGNAPLVFRRATRTLYGLASELLRKHAHQLTEGMKIVCLSVTEEFAEA